jgi:hypothetical protein
MKIRPGGAHTDTLDIQTDMTELTVAIHNFANALKMNTLARPLFLVSRLCSLPEVSPLGISVSAHYNLSIFMH